MEKKEKQFGLKTYFNFSILPDLFLSSRLLCLAGCMVPNWI